LGGCTCTLAYFRYVASPAYQAPSPAITLAARTQSKRYAGREGACAVNPEPLPAGVFDGAGCIAGATSVGKRGKIPISPQAIAWRGALGHSGCWATQVYELMAAAEAVQWPVVHLGTQETSLGAKDFSCNGDIFQLISNKGRRKPRGYIHDSPRAPDMVLCRICLCITGFRGGPISLPGGLMNKVSRRLFVVGLAAPLAGLVAACSGPDNPKPADVPPVQVKQDTGPQEIPTRPSTAPTYGASKKYQDSMKNIEKQQGGP
jgi:hypothetical protein